MIDITDLDDEDLACAGMRRAFVNEIVIGGVGPLSIERGGTLIAPVAEALDRRREREEAARVTIEPRKANAGAIKRVRAQRSAKGEACALTDLEIRLPIRRAAERLGISHRAAQALAARGEMPGAAKIGGAWTVNPRKLSRWIEERERECQSKTYIAEPEYGGCEPPSRAASTEKRYAQAMSKLLGVSETAASKKSSKRATGARVSCH